MHPAIIIGTVRSLLVDVAMGQIPRSTERISSFLYFIKDLLVLYSLFSYIAFLLMIIKVKVKSFPSHMGPWGGADLHFL